MADRFIGYERGSDLSPDKATVGSSSTAALDVEIRWTVGVGLTRQEITDIVEACLRRLNDGRDANFTL